MSDRYTPTYTIRNIADVTAGQLKSEHIGGLVFARSQGILTSMQNPNWFHYAKSFRSLGTQGIRFYLISDGSVAADFFNRPNDQLSFEQIVHPAAGRNALRAGLAEIPHAYVTPSTTEAGEPEVSSVALVGNSLSDMAVGNRAGFPTILMPELVGTKGLRAVMTRPVEAAARFVRRVPFQPASFPRFLEKDGQPVAKGTHEQTEEPA